MHKALTREVRGGTARCLAGPEARGHWFCERDFSWMHAVCVLRPLCRCWGEAHGLLRPWLIPGLECC